MTDLCFDAPVMPGDRATETSVSQSANAEPVLVRGCAGWLHRPAAGCLGQVAVLLCPGFAWDGLLAHQALRVMADRLAEAGYPTLRFSYPGHGDSRDLDDTERDAPVAAWLDSVNGAADWLRSGVGCRGVVLAGVRFGATLAALAAATRDDVAGLLLIAPVLRGKSYLTQLTVEAKLESGVDAGGTLDFHELHLGLAAMAPIAAIDLQQVRLRAGVSVGLFGPSSTRLADDCAVAWSAGGAHVTVEAMGGLAPMLQQAIHSDPAPLDTQVVLAWLDRAAPVRPAAVGREQATDICPLRLAGLTERPLSIGPGKSIHGVLCEPDGLRADAAVVIVNSGRDPRAGIGRFGVLLARQLASAGIASLRLDFTGLGDSPGLHAERDVLGPLFDRDRTGEVGAAIEALERLGYRRFAVQGLCSGAYHAMQAALADERVGALLLVNLPVFEWRAGDTVESVARDLAPGKEYVAKVMDPAFWRRIARGDIALGRIVQSRSRRLLGAIRTRGAAIGLAGMQGVPQRKFSRLSGRGVRTLLLFGAGDAGLNAVEQAFGPDGAHLRVAKDATLEIMPGLDHVLSRSAMRQAVTDRLVAFATTAFAKVGGNGHVATVGFPSKEVPAHDDQADDHRADGRRRRAARQVACPAD